jgi:putative glutamine amidotransferase
VRVLLVHCDHRPFEVECFSRAWELAGGIPVELLPVTPASARSLPPDFADAAGLLLSGGPDVEPWRFGATPEPGVELHLDPARDALDLELLRQAEREAWPVLAICYGCQILAVSAGGTVIQDLEKAGKPGHRVPDPKDRLAHDVIVSTEARFLAPAGGRFAANSHHHQAVADPGTDLGVVARAPDGVIEALEAGTGSRFVLGVQWHPENLTGEEHVALFRTFRAACIARSRDRGLRSRFRGAR